MKDEWRNRFGIGTCQKLKIEDEKFLEEQIVFLNSEYCSQFSKLLLAVFAPIRVP